MTTNNVSLDSSSVSADNGAGKRGRWNADPIAIKASFEAVKQVAGLDSLLLDKAINPWHKLGHSIEGLTIDDVRLLLGSKMKHVPVFAVGDKAGEIAFNNEDLIGDLFTSQRNGEAEKFTQALHRLFRTAAIMLPYSEKTTIQTVAPSLVNPNGRYETVTQKHVDKRAEACDITRAVLVTADDLKESVIATVGGTHTLFNGSDMCDALEALAIASNGSYRPLTAGTQYGQKRAFISGTIDGIDKMPLPVDEMKTFLNMVQGFDGTLSLMFGDCSMLIVCQNTMSHAISSLTKSGLKFKNAGNVKARVDAAIAEKARIELDNAVNGANMLSKLSEKMLNEPVSQASAFGYLSRYVFGEEGFEKMRKRQADGKEMPTDAESRLNAAWLCYTSSPGQAERGVNPVSGHGNLWALYQATTAFERHVRPKQDAFETTFGLGNGAKPTEFVQVLRNDFPAVFSF